MYKNIVPGLISFDTTLNKLRGSYYSDNFNYYSEVKKRSRFHYRVFIDDDIKIPQKYDFKDAFFIKSENRWYYERKLGPIKLKFCFDPAKKTFSFNRIYTFIPFPIGDIFPVGLQISDFINLDLFLSGITSFKGCAFNYNHENMCVLAPSNNGKTRLLEKVLEKNGRYIAEDVVLLDLQENIVYPNTIRSNIFAKKADRWLRDLGSEKLITEPQRVSEIFLIQNVTSKRYFPKNKSIYSYFHLWRVPFNANPLLRSYVFEELLRDKIDHRLSMLKRKNDGWTFKQIKGFNYEFLERNEN